MRSVRSVSQGCGAPSLKTRALYNGGRAVHFCSNARRSARIIAYKEDDPRRQVQKAVEKLPDGNIAPSRGQETSNDISASTSKASNPVQAVVRDIQDDEQKYDQSAFQLPLWQPGFTRRREVFVGRIAMLGFFGTLIGEVWTRGLGPVAQLSYETGYSERIVTAVIGLTAAYAFFGGLAPWSRTFSSENQEDVAKRPDGPIQKGPVSVQENLGITSYGFTKANEVFVGRMAMLGFLSAVVAERYLHTGPAGQVALYFNWPVNYDVVGMGVAISVAAILVAAAGLGNYGQVRGGKDIY